MVVGCSAGATRREGDKQPVQPKTIQQVQEEHTPAWMALPGVVGTAIGEHNGRPCIVVYVARVTDELKAKIPATVEGYPVVLEQTGEFHAL
jgi:hypothetical protein